MCQGRFIYCNKCTTLERNVNKGRSYRRRVAAVELLQSCPTLCNPIDGSPPGSPVPGILQARTLEWVAMTQGGEGDIWGISVSYPSPQ